MPQIEHHSAVPKQQTSISITLIRFIPSPDSDESHFSRLFQLESDVKKEFDRISSCDMKTQSKKEPLLVNRLFKKFKKDKKDFVAVDCLTFGVSPKECFG